jgi:hypothetical protein
MKRKRVKLLDMKDATPTAPETDAHCARRTARQDEDVARQREIDARYERGEDGEIADTTNPADL